MNVIDFFWIFLMLSALQPVLRQKMIEAARQRMIARIEKKRGSRVIILIHRQETMSLLGFPLMRFIDINDAEEVLRAIQLTDPDIPLDLVLHTPGGLVLAALQIARAVKKHPAKVTVFVPHYAMSGGTLIALAADEIVMCKHAVLGPVDPQINQQPAASILRVLQRKDPNEIDDQTLILADVAEKAINQVRLAVRQLLADRMPEDRAEEVARLLSEGTWTHDYPLTSETLQQLGIPASTEMPTEFVQLLQLFPQPRRGQASVEYIPAPYRYHRPSQSSAFSKSRWLSGI
ncbi:MAG: SDH family Clp fold serine proteinase [Thermogutta sp.]